MNFVHVSILAGLAAVSIPLLLHLLGRREPQLIDFPALRFVRQAQLEESTSWQLRHILLLLLRILLILVIVLALARPRVHTAIMGSMIGISGLVLLACLASLIAAVARATHRPLSIWGIALLAAVALWLGVAGWTYRTFTAGPALPNSDSNAPVAAALIVDTSPSMAYRANNQSRLDAAKEMASWLLERMPADSHLGILSGAPMSALSLNPRAAESQLSVIQETTEQIDLLARIRTAMDLVLADELERKEIYVLTDMKAAAWGAAQNDLRETVQLHKDEVLIQIIDVGVTDTTNWQLGDPQVDFHVVPVGGDVTVRVPVTQSTFGALGSTAVTVELWQEAIDPRLPVISGGSLQVPQSSVVAREVVELSGDGTVEVELTAKNLKEGIHHFSIQLDKNDPLSVDNQRFVSIAALRQQPTLIVADDPDIQRILQLIIDPTGALQQAELENLRSSTDDGTTDGQIGGLITTLRYSQLPQAVLTRYSVIILFDMPTMAKTVVDVLQEHVVGGGGLLVVLGPSLEAAISQSAGSQASPSGLDDSAIASLLPGQALRLLSRPREDRGTFWQPTATTHPVYQELEFPPNEIAWQLMPIFKSWSFETLRANTQVLATLSSSQDALMTAQPLGRGQILTLLTPLPELEQPRRQLWNELWISEQYWWAFGILSGSIRTLSGADQIRLSFPAGTPVYLPNETTHWPSRWDLYTPSARRVGLEAVEGTLSVGQHSQPGTYRLRGNLGVPVTRGFSVNIPASHTDLQPLDPVQLESLLGEGGFRVARGREEMASSVGQARFGQELYPLLMLFVAGIFLAEQFMSNRFYKIQLRFGKGGR